MKHNARWTVAIWALALLGGCGGTTLTSRRETISVADELFRRTDTDNSRGFFAGFLYRALTASRQAGEIVYAPDEQSIPTGAQRVNGAQVTLRVSGGAGSREDYVTRTSEVGYFVVLGLPVKVTVTLSVNWNNQTFEVDVTGRTTRPYDLHGSFGSAGPIDPPDFADIDTGPIDIEVTAAKAHYTLQNFGYTPASGKLFISEKNPAEIDAGNVATEATLLATVPPEGSIPPGEVLHVEDQNVLNPTLRQFLENDQTFYVYALATAPGGVVNVQVTNLQITVRAEVKL